MIDSAILVTQTPLGAYIENVIERVAKRVSRKQANPKMMDLGVEVPDFRKHVDYLKSSKFTYLIVACYTL